MIAFLKCSFTCQYFWARLLLRTWISEIIVEKDICGYFFCCIDRTNETEFELVQRQWLGLVKRLAIRDSMMKNDQNKWLESREGDSSHLFTMPGTIVWAAGLVIYKKKKKKKKKKKSHCLKMPMDNLLSGQKRKRALLRAQKSDATMVFTFL